MLVDNIGDPMNVLGILLKIIWKVLFPFGTQRTSWLLFTVLVLWPIGFSYVNKFVWVPATAALAGFKSVGKSLHGLYAFAGFVDGEPGDQTFFGLLRDVATFFKGSILQTSPQSKITSYKKLLVEARNQLRLVKEGISVLG